jgi:pyridoxamine 5'-phosphate oxidase-like protein
MSNREPTETTNLDTLYGSDTIPWARAREALDANALGPETVFVLGTVRPDGRPHAAGIGAAWHDGDLYFKTGPKTQKGRNLAANPACTMFARVGAMDLVFEGEARRVTDTPTLEALAALYNESGWPVTVEGDTFTAPYSAPSAGPPPWHLFRVTTHTVFCVSGTEPAGATRWRF